MIRAIVLAASLACAAASSSIAAESAEEEALLARLADAPEDAEARFELGRAYFERRLDRAAEFQLRQALADALSPVSAAEARQLLAALQRRRRWIVSFDSALLPDRGADGLDAAASDGSGFGVAAVASAEHRAPIGEATRLSVQAAGFGRLFESADLNDATATVLAGPLWLLEGDDLWSLRAFAQSRWVANAKELDSIGVELATRRSLSGRLRGFARATVREADYVLDARDGLHAGADADLVRYGPSGRFERVFGAVFRAEATARSQRFWQARLGVGAYRETGFGLGIYVEPFLVGTEYDGPDPGSGIVRTDTELGGRLRVVKRDWRLWSAAPYIELEARRVESTIARFEGTSEGLVLGFTRTF